MTQNGLHASQLLCTAHELFFMHCTQVIIRVLHDSKKQMSNALSSARESIFLCALWKLTAIICQRRIKAYNVKAPQQNMIKHVDTKKKYSVKYLRTPIPFHYRWHFYWTNWTLNNIMIMAQGLDSTGTTNLTSGSIMHTCVRPQNAIKGLELRC